MKSRVTAWSAPLVCALLISGAAAANPLTPRGQDYASPTMRIFGPGASTLRLCQFLRAHAPGVRAGAAARKSLSGNGGSSSRKLEAVNRGVNHEIEPITDAEHYGLADYWTIPTTKGDCEDYVLLKRKRLMALGWPASALLITVVRDERGEGHAVLTVRITQGDFILDNKTDEIMIWHRTRYDYVMRQSYLNPRVWMSLDPREGNPAQPLAAMRDR